MRPEVPVPTAVGAARGPIAERVFQYAHLLPLHLLQDVTVDDEPEERDRRGRRCPGPLRVVFVCVNCGGGGAIREREGTRDIIMVGILRIVYYMSFGRTYTRNYYYVG